VLTITNRAETTQEDGPLLILIGVPWF